MVVRLLAERFVGAALVMWLVATGTFFMMRIAPGGPFDSERALSAEAAANIAAKYHLDEPLIKQYGRYMAMLAQGDFGPSFRYGGRSVNEIFAECLPRTLQVGFCGLMVALVLGVGAGLLGAYYPRSAIDHLAMFGASLGISLPSFVIGPLFVLVFGVWLEWLPVAGLDDWASLVLPSLTLGVMYAAFFARLTRVGMLEVLQQDFIRTAYSKGLPKWKVFIVHALRGGIIPAVSFFGPAAAAMLTGSLVVETVFNIPGLGRFFVQSALARDYTLVMGCVLLVAFSIVVMNLIVDFLYFALDPRIGHDS